MVHCYFRDVDEDDIKECQVGCRSDFHQATWKCETGICSMRKEHEGNDVILYGGVPDIEIEDNGYCSGKLTGMRMYCNDGGYFTCATYGEVIFYSNTIRCRSLSSVTDGATVACSCTECDCTLLGLGCSRFYCTCRVPPLRNTVLTTPDLVTTSVNTTFTTKLTNRQSGEGTPTSTNDLVTSTNNLDLSSNVLLSGIVGGGAVVLCMVIIGILLLLFRRRKLRKQKQNSDGRQDLTNTQDLTGHRELSEREIKGTRVEPNYVNVDEATLHDRQQIENMHTDDTYNHLHEKQQPSAPVLQYDHLENIHKTPDGYDLINSQFNKRPDNLDSDYDHHGHTT